MDTNHRSGGVKVERRRYARIRDIFDEAYRVASPLLSSPGETGSLHSGNMLHLALHDAFPTLHKQDIPILAASLTRVFREQNKGDAP
jgi:hypothetical protein